MIMNRNAVLLFGIIAIAQLHYSESFALKTAVHLPVWSQDPSQSTGLSIFRRKKLNNPNGTFQSPQDEHPEEVSNDLQNSPQLKTSRRSFLSVTTVGASLIHMPKRTFAAPEKQTNISDNELKQIILADIVNKSFLVTADITRSVYDESAIFTDEIDEYTMEKWIKGTKSLFIPSGSRVSLVGDVEVSKTEVSFRFDEDLMFNIPFKPVCSLTGKVVLTRDANTGLITSYREYWDQSVNEVLKTAKFGKKA